jgi:hypothetical protein
MPKHHLYQAIIFPLRPFADLRTIFPPTIPCGKNIIIIIIKENCIGIL